MDIEERKQLQLQTGWPSEIVDAISSAEEARIYQRARLKAARIGGRWALIRSDID